jgi:hypothetical protein
VHTGLVPLAPETRTALQWVRADFDQLTRGAGPEELSQPSDGTRWTNRELLFHMWFGQRIARVVVPVMGAFSRLPAPASRTWAAVLAAATRPYEWVNYAGSAAGGRLVGLETTRRRMGGDTDWLLGWADRATDADLARGMSVPVGWDPYFSARMTRADLLAWAPVHYRHHRAQLTLAAVRR